MREKVTELTDLSAAVCVAIMFDQMETRSLIITDLFSNQRNISKEHFIHRSSPLEGISIPFLNNVLQYQTIR